MQMYEAKYLDELLRAVSYTHLDVYKRQSFRWVNINNLTEHDVTFKTDKTVVNLLKKQGL